MKPFQKFKYLQNKRSCLSEIKVLNIFRGLLVARNYLRHESAPLKILPSPIDDFELFVSNAMAVT